MRLSVSCCHVLTQDYYRRSVLSSSKTEPFYMLPESRYEFDHPEGTGHEVANTALDES